MSGSFRRGEGRWRGTADVFDSAGRYAGEGRDARVVRRDLGGDCVEVEVSFKGPFELSGAYRISDRGDHRRYEGPLNYGYAETLGEGLIDANNYWPSIGLSQRIFLMVLPGGATQLSLALLSRGEQTAYTVVGEYHRRCEDEDEGAVGLDCGTGPPLSREGTWKGTLNLLGTDLLPLGSTDYSEQTIAGEGGRQDLTLRSCGFADDATLTLNADRRGLWSDPGDVTGSASAWGGRALAGNFHFSSEGLRLWRREVIASGGETKGVLHTWFSGGRRIGAAYGALRFEPGAQA